MRRLRELHPPSGSNVAFALRLLDEAEPLVESPESMERVTRALWRRRAAPIPTPARPRLRLALALVLLVGSITVAGAAVVRRILQSQTTGSAHAPSALKVRSSELPPPPSPAPEAKGHGSHATDAVAPPVGSGPRARISSRVVAEEHSMIARSSPASLGRSGAATDQAGSTPAPLASPAITPGVTAAGSGDEGGRVATTPASRPVVTAGFAEEPAPAPPNPPVPAAATGGALDARATAGRPDVTGSMLAAPREEAAIVEAGMYAVRVAHDPIRAGRLFEDYLRRYPHGALVEVASTLGIDAAAAAGDRARGVRLARSYLKQFPNGQFAVSVRRFLEEHKNGRSTRGPSDPP